MAFERHELEKYRAGWMERESEEVRANTRLREKALSEVIKISQILTARYRVEKIILFGSLLDEDRFSAASDIDIAVEGLEKSVYFTALGELLMESSFEIDLVPVEDASPLLLQRLKNGKVIYEKGKNPRAQSGNQQ